MAEIPLRIDQTQINSAEKKASDRSAVPVAKLTTVTPGLVPSHESLSGPQEVRTRRRPLAELVPSHLPSLALLPRRPQVEATATLLEVVPPPDSIDKSIAVLIDSAFEPDTTSAIVKSIYPVTSTNPIAKQVHFIETDAGVDALVSLLNPDELHRHEIPIETTEWGGPLQGIPVEPAFKLRGLFEQKARLWKDTQDNMYEVQILPSPERFNDVMKALGRNPGVDSFKLVGVNEAKFSDKTYVESVAKLEIPVARKSESLIAHDRNVNDHVGFWWTTPPEVALTLQKEAKRVLATEDDKQIHQFAVGLDEIALLSTTLIPEMTKIIDSPLDTDEITDDRLNDTIALIGEYTNYLGANTNKYSLINTPGRTRDIVTALIQTGLIEKGKLTIIQDTHWPYHQVRWSKDNQGKTRKDSPELLRVRPAFADITILYAKSIMDTLLKIDALQGPPPDVDLEKRFEAVQKIKNDLTYAAVETYMEPWMDVIRY